MTALTLTAGPWQTQAVCAAHPDPKLFHDPDHQPLAVLWCDMCPVRAECHAEARRDGHTGVWGGVWFDGGRPQRKRR